MSYSTFNSIAISGVATAIPTEKKTRVVDDNTLVTITASQMQTTADFGYTAAKFILDKKKIPLEEVGIIIFASKTPDYRGPATAAVLQGRLDFSKDCIAYDINIGSSGFIYGSQLVCSNLDSINKNYGLLIVGDTSTKQRGVDDSSTIGFGDGASAILFEKSPTATPIYFHTKAYSNYYQSYMIPQGGFRKTLQHTDNEHTNYRSIEGNHLKIDDELFLSFAKTELSNTVSDFLEHFNLASDDFDLLALHQFNETSVNLITEKLKQSFKTIPVNYAKFGNTCGNSLPLLFTDIFGPDGIFEKRILACAYGEGFSLGVMDMTIKTDVIFDIITTNQYFEEGMITHEA